jgi:hypothetical protein
MQSLKHIPMSERAGHCYKWAWRAVREEPAAARLRLVHGWCGGSTSPYTYDHYGHAWVLLPGGRVYDVIADKYFSPYEYAVLYHAIVGRVYTRKQAAKAVLRHGHCGPWWTDDEMRLHMDAGLPTD